MSKCELGDAIYRVGWIKSTVWALGCCSQATGKVILVLLTRRKPKHYEIEAELLKIMKSVTNHHVGTHC